MTDIYIVITEDRHADTEVAPFADDAAAFAHAEHEVAGTEDQDRELNDRMKALGWLWFCGYGSEGDTVRVVRRELRDSDLRDFTVVSDMAMVCCPRPPCHEHCVPQTLGEAIDWVLNHDCEAAAASTAGE